MMIKEMTISQRMQNLPKNNFNVIAQLKKKLRLQGETFIDLSAGITDLKPDPRILEKLSEYSLDSTLHTYAAKFDMIDLHQAIRDFFYEDFNIDIEPFGCSITLGSKEAISHIHSVLLDENDVVLVPELHYPFYSLSAQYYKATPYLYELNDQYLPVLHTIPKHILDRAKVLWINYPHNPTGAIIDDQSIRMIVEFCKYHNIFLCADMAYSHINFTEKKSPTILKYYHHHNKMIELHTISKNFSLPGWRIGFALGNPDVLQTMLESKSIFDTGGFMVTQKAGAYAIKNYKSIIPNVVKTYEARSSYMYQRLSALGYTIFKAEGTYFLWIKVPTGYTGESYAQYLLKQKKVLLLDGKMFGPKGINYVRLALTESISVLEDVIKGMDPGF